LTPTNPFDPEAEVAFVRQVLHNDRSASDAFVARLACVPRMLAIRNHKLGRPLTDEELDDVAQDAFVVVLRRLGDYRPVAPLESWMHGICCFLLREAVRRKHRERCRAAALDDDTAGSERAVPSLLGDSAEAQNLLAHLPVVEAQVLALKHLDGLTFVEVGARLRISPNTAKTLYYRGLAKVRAAWRDKRGEEEKSVATPN
jgi:RNA polymerase sigma-70 factor (ECF subfamily)